MIRVAINGYGRIGRNAHRHLIGHSNLKIVAINARSENFDMRGHLLKYDSLHGRCESEIRVEGNNMIVDNDEILLLAESNAKNLPWKELDIDIVIEATGRLTTLEKASDHIIAGAKRVVVSAPMKDDTPTFVIGVNEDGLTKDHHVVSNASCTTNCIAPVLKVVDEAYGIENVMVSSIHSFTASQNLLDNMGGDPRKSRSAVQSVIPTTTGSVKATALILPQLKGKIDGMAFRVPIATSSCADMTIVLKKETTKDELNQAFRDAAATPRMNKVLSVCDEPLVSIDFKTDHHSSIVDTLSTKVVQGKYVQVLSWYDNEWGYALRLVEMVERVANFMKK